MNRLTSLTFTALLLAPLADGQKERYEEIQTNQ